MTDCGLVADALPVVYGNGPHQPIRRVHGRAVKSVSSEPEGPGSSPETAD